MPDFCSVFEIWGLGIVNPVADYCYKFSLHSTAFLQSCILGLVDFELDAHITSVNSSKVQDKEYQSQQYLIN